MLWKENSLGFVLIQKTNEKKNGKLYTIKSNAMGGLKWMLKKMSSLLNWKKNHSIQNQKQEAACHRMNYTHCLTRSSKQKI